ncbi:sigma-70 family RNA polymerase sigma factor [Actinospica sp. MGRD01-02]|uniref:Sigma-70 family RNA polymerase sigma factor n=1 Tax=Actinospica acidithermotolerans TaxID=2828514 RepID=A0A941EDI5_9ACTN|nr:sigma-70 family RNA polymerase sigma factor [Actinospica acidithermotolerans]MBR7828430.1 sigma-70 family RNA polymerase sigma factor [Actinospica acidithermotolerans]
MDDVEWLARAFAEHRARLQAMAYRMLGSFADAEDVLQDAWLRASTSDAHAGEIENPAGWLTTVVGRVCLNLLRTRRTRAEEPWELHLPDAVVSAEGAAPAPEDAALLSDRVGLALQIVLDELAPDERVAFVLHDLFAVPFADIAAVLGRSDASARQLASRARRRVADAGTSAPDQDVPGQRAVVDAFYAAARNGDLDGLVAVLHPDVVARADFGGRRLPTPAMLRGADAVAENARIGFIPEADLHPVLINGAVGTLVVKHGRPFALMAFTVVDGRIAALDVYGDRARIARLAYSVLRTL